MIEMKSSGQIRAFQQNEAKSWIWFFQFALLGFDFVSKFSDFSFTEGLSINLSEIMWYFYSLAVLFLPIQSFYTCEFSIHEQQLVLQFL